MTQLVLRDKVFEMTPSEAYFYRNRGSWDWKVEFEVVSYRDLWRADIPLISKVRLSAFALGQLMFGPSSMWTHVDFQNAQKIVHHSTRLKKWGLTFYKSAKDFELDDDGRTLRLRGDEYFWPLICLPVSFAPLSGVVDESTTSAFYQMPLAGTACDCRTYLDYPDGFIAIQTPWLKGRFTLTGSSVEKLASRLAEKSLEKLASRLAEKSYSNR